MTAALAGPAADHAELAGSDHGSGRSTDRRLRATAPRVALALAVVAALIVTVLLGRQGLTERSKAQDRADAVAAARQVAVNFSTLDYRTFDRDIARVTNESTGAFRSDFAAQAAQIKQVVVSDHSVSTGQVGSVALVSSSPTSARALVVLDATVTNTSATTPAARHYRVQLDLTKVSGHWLASQLEFVG